MYKKLPYGSSFMHQYFLEKNNKVLKQKLLTILKRKDKHNLKISKNRKGIKKRQFKQKKQFSLQRNIQIKNDNQKLFSKIVDILANRKKKSKWFCLLNELLGKRYSSVCVRRKAISLNKPFRKKQIVKIAQEN